MGASEEHVIRKAHVIVNPAAGQPGDAILSTLYQVFSKGAGIEWDVSLTHKSGDGARLTREALETEPDAIVVYGGDGTVREVASVLKGGDVPMAVLPGGTGNLFAVHLGMPRPLRRAARVIAGPHHIERVDVGIANGRTFVVAAATGLIAETMEEAARGEMKERMGYPAYLISGYRKLRELKHAHYRIELNGERVEDAEGIACLVSNTNSVGIQGVNVPAGGSNQDGLLDVLLFHGVDPQTVLSVVGEILGLQELTTPLTRWPAKRIRIETDPPQPFNLDGDGGGMTPVDIEILPRALPVIVPRRQRP